MKKSKTLAMIPLGVLMGSATAHADNGAMRYSYLSGGAIYDKNSWNKPLAECFKQGIGDVYGVLTQQDLTPKRSSLGGYLHGGYALDDNIFLEAKLHYLGGRKNGYFFGVGYRLAVTDNTDFYMIGGVSQPDLPASVRLNQKGKESVQNGPKRFIKKLLTKTGAAFDKQMALEHSPESKVINKLLDQLTGDLKEAFLEIPGQLTLAEFLKTKGIDSECFVDEATEILKSKFPLQKTVDNSEISLKSRPAPALEVGYRISFTEQLGAQLAYRGSYDSVRINGKLFNAITQKFTSVNDKKRGLSHEGRVEATYAFNPNLTAEIGYKMSKMFKVGAIKPKMSHYCTAGLRYSF